MVNGEERKKGRIVGKEAAGYEGRVHDGYEVQKVSS